MNWLKKHYSRLSIRLQLIALAAAAGLLSLLVLSLATVGLVGWAAQQSMQHQQDLMRPLLVAALTGPMIERNYAAVQEIAQAIADSESVAEIAVFSAAGDRVVAVVGVRSTVPATDVARMAVSLAEGGLDFGRVELGLSPSAFSALTDRLLLVLFALMGLMMLFALLLFNAWARRLGRRVKNLAAGTKAFAAGQYDARIAEDDEGSDDEFGRLAQSFNRMAAQVESSIDALAVSESRWSAILESIGDGLIATDTTMRVTYLNPIAEALTGWSQAEAGGRSVGEVFRIENVLTGRPAEIPVARVLECGHIVGLANHTVLIASDGTRRHIADSAAPIRDAQGRLVGVVMVFHDVTEAYNLRASLDENRTRLALALQGADLGLWDRNLATDEVFYDQRWASMLGYRPDEIARTRAAWKALVHPDDLPAVKRAMRDHLDGGTPRYEAEYRMRSKSGDWCWILSRGQVTARDAAGRPLRVTGTHLDVSEKKRAQAEIERMAFFDPLTGLPNRRLLQDRLGLALAGARRNDACGALLFIDLDQFKRLNDTRGHNVGDQLLVEVAARLRAQLRETDTVARMGGDEFVVLLNNLSRRTETAAGQAHDVAENLRIALADEFFVAGAAHRASASIGVALFPSAADESGNKPADQSADDLLRRADAAMYAAKEAGRNKVCFFDPAMQAATLARMELERDLRQALDRGELRLFLQAQTDVAGRSVGAEVLLRWQHPVQGLLAPDKFIPLAEETGLIVPIGAWVLAGAISLLKQLEDDEHALRLSVNVSPRQFLEPNFVAQVSQLLHQSGAYPPRLTLEITEGLLLADIDAAIAHMNELRHLGVNFSVDDFGVGYSSLSYLKRLPLRELKIDRAFVAGLPRDPNDVALVGLILDIAESFRLDVVAEGVETEAQKDFLRANGCALFQGYLFGRPQPTEAFLAQLAQERTQST